MTWNEIVSAICIGLSSAILGVSLQGKSKLKILFIQMFSTSLYLASYLFVLNIQSSALIGAITASFEVLRLVVFYVIEKNEKFNTKKNNLISMISFCVIMTVCSIFGWTGWYCIFPLFSAILVSLALGLKNLLVIKTAFLIQSVCITAYLLLLSLWLNAGFEIIVFISGIISLINILKSQKKTESGTEIVNDITVKE